MGMSVHVCTCTGSSVYVHEAKMVAEKGEHQTLVEEPEGKKLTLKSQRQL